MLPNGATVTTETLEFHPDGTVFNVVANAAQTIADAVTLTITRREQVENGNDQWRRQDSAPVAGASASSRCVVSMGLLTTVSLGVAQLFAAVDAGQPASRAAQTSTTALAEQKMEQLRSLTWGFDQNGAGPAGHRHDHEPLGVSRRRRTAPG